MKGLAADLRHAFRVYARTPWSSGLAVIVLAVALAFVSSFLSLYIDLVYSPHPGYEDSGELVRLGQNDGAQFRAVSIDLLERINEGSRTLDIAAGFSTTFQRIGPDREQAPIELVSAGFFEGIRPRLALGRGFDSGDHQLGAEPVAVLSYAWWQRYFDGDLDVIGRTIEAAGRQQLSPPSEDGEPPESPEETTTQFRIIGVMDESLPSLQTADTAFWSTMEIGVPLFYGPWEMVRGFTMMPALGRRAGNAPDSAIAAELDALLLESEAPNVDPSLPFDVVTSVAIDVNAQRNATRQLLLFFAGSILVAVVAAANVSLFLLSRAPGRRRELGIRMSVGAPLRRLARQLATEAALLIVLAAAIGLLATFWLTRFLQGLAFLEGASFGNVSLFDWRVVGAVLLFLLALTLLVSLAPVLGLKKLGIASSARQVSTRANMTQRMACTAQVAIAGAVAAAAIAFGWYLSLLITADHGYDGKNVFFVNLINGETFGGINFDESTFDTDRVERDRRVEFIRSVPGFEQVAVGSAAPGITNFSFGFGIPRPDAPDENISFQVVAADREYFDLFDIEVLDGSVYDGNELDVMIFNQAGAEFVWGRTDVVGENIPIDMTNPDGIEVVAVVADVPHGHPDEAIEPRAYLPFLPTGNTDFVFIRSTLSAADVRAGIQGLIDAGDLEMRIQEVERLSDRTGALIAADRARSILTIGSALVVVILAGLGFYGTQRYLVTAGRREYAIRASLGAGPRALRRLVILRGVLLSLPGIVLGGLLAFILAAWLRDDYVSLEVSPGIVTSVVIAGLLVLLLAASFGPALQAGRTQPAPLLRQE